MKKRGNRSEFHSERNYYLQNWYFSDVTIIVYDESLLDKSKTFDCHKDIFSCQSEIFKAMLTGNTTVESSSGEVQITDVSVEGMEVLLRYVHYCTCTSVMFPRRKSTVT